MRTFPARALGTRFPSPSRRRAFCPPTAAPDTFLSDLPAFLFHAKQDADISGSGFRFPIPAADQEEGILPPPTAAPDTFVSNLPAFCFP